MRDMTGGKDEEEEEEYVADCADEEDNEVEEEEDAVATIVGVQVARRKPSDRKSERVGKQEELDDLSDSLCRLLRWWLPQPFNRAMVNVCVIGEFLK
jgi:hypothetical protein